MNKSLVLLAVWLALTLPGWSAQLLFEWFGDQPLPPGQTQPPRPVEGRLGKLRELEFSGGSRKDGTAAPTFLEIPLVEGPYAELTFACFINPRERKTNESLLHCRGAKQKAGFSLIKAWMRWKLDLGDGQQRASVRSEVRESHFAADQWQHIALTFNHGKIAYYRDGILVEEREVPVTEIMILPGTTLRIGAGGGAPPMVSRPFSGRMGGIFLDDKALDAREIVQLLQRANP